jgi:Restriction endonuclease fold toxin 9
LFANTGRGGETVDTIRGRQAHRNYRDAVGSDYEYNQPLPSGQRPDAIDWPNRIVRELKPDNLNAIQRGLKQLERYKQELEKITSQKWTSYLDTYRK